MFYNLTKQKNKSKVKCHLSTFECALIGFFFFLIHPAFLVDNIY